MADLGTAAGAANSGTGDPATSQPADQARTGNGSPDAGKTISMEEAERIATERSTRAESSATPREFESRIPLPNNIASPNGELCFFI